MKGMNFKGSPMKQDVKEIKGTSIFGVEVADMKKSIVDMVRKTNRGVGEGVKKAYDKYKTNNMSKKLSDITPTEIKEMKMDKRWGKKLGKSTKSIKGLDKEQSRKDRLDYQSGGTGGY